MGGKKLYKEAFSLPETSTIYLTEIDVDGQGKIIFPAIDLSYWQLMQGEYHVGNPPVTFKTYKRSCPLCPEHQRKFFRRLLKEEEMFDFVPYQRKIIACYKRGHAEHFNEIDEAKARAELRGFEAWLRGEYRREELTSYRFPGFNHLHAVFE